MTTSKSPVIVHRASTVHNDYELKETLLINQVPGEAAVLHVTNLWEEDGETHKASSAITLNAEQWAELARFALAQSIEKETYNANLVHQLKADAEQEALEKKRFENAVEALRILRELRTFVPQAIGEEVPFRYTVGNLSTLTYLRDAGLMEIEAGEVTRESRGTGLSCRITNKGIAILDEQG